MSPAELDALLETLDDYGGTLAKITAAAIRQLRAARDKHFDRWQTAQVERNALQLQLDEAVHAGVLCNDELYGVRMERDALRAEAKTSFVAGMERAAVLAVQGGAVGTARRIRDEAKAR